MLSKLNHIFLYQNNLEYLILQKIFFLLGLVCQLILLLNLLLLDYNQLFYNLLKNFLIKLSQLREEVIIL